jgi:5''-nucleotidase/2'',3''-cyclic phosphodiesterase and related esterases
MEKIQIVHTNDLHSHFENFPRVSRFIEQLVKIVLPMIFIYLISGMQWIELIL